MTCRPTPNSWVERNQQLTMKVLMNPKFRRLNEFFTTITDNSSHAHFDADPDAEKPLCRSRVLNLYCACVFGKNALTAARLSAKGLSIQKLLSLSIQALKAHSIREKVGDDRVESSQARRPSAESQGGASARGWGLYLPHETLK